MIKLKKIKDIGILMKYKLQIIVAWIVAVTMILSNGTFLYCCVGTVSFDLMLYHILISLFVVMILIVFTNHSSKTIFISIFIILFISLIMKMLSTGEIGFPSLWSYFITDSGRYIGLILGVLLYVDKKSVKIHFPYFLVLLLVYYFFFS